MIAIKRIYDPYSDGDGIRILVDRIWPRGIKKEEARLDVWMKNIAPSTDLRKWFNHDPERFNEFRARYKEELYTNQTKRSALFELSEMAREKKVTLLYAARDIEHNNAVVLQEEILAILNSY